MPLVNTCIQKVDELIKEKYPNASIKKIILESHSEKKRSYHIILRITDDDNNEILFENVNVLKDLYKSFGLDTYKDSENRHLVDPSVYREGLFRTLYSSKNGEKRPLVRCNLSDAFDDIEAFVCYTPEN